MKRSDRLRALDVLAGRWTAEAIPGDGRVVAREELTFEWIEEGAFLACRTTTTVLPDAPDVWHRNAPRSSHAVIAVDDQSGGFTYAYADSRGVSRVYAMTFADGRWTLSGQAYADFHQRFEAAVTADAIDGRYERSADGVAWDLDFEVRFRRVT